MKTFNTDHPLRVAVAGASGYAGAELVGLLLGHPGVSLEALYVSEASLDAGRPIGEIDGRLIGRTDLTLSPLSDPAAAARLPGGGRLDAVLLCTDHAVSASLAPKFLEAGVTVLDLSGAFRLSDPDAYPRFYGFAHERPELLWEAVYALGEWVDRSELAEARLIALPGCYPTAAQLALRPLLAAGLLDPAMKPVIDAVSGVSGAGRKARLSSAFCEVSLAAYGIFTHRHRPEIEEHLGAGVVFNPHLGSFRRGILETITARLAPGIDPAAGAQALSEAYRQAYLERPLVRVREAGVLPKLGDVTGTPFCDIGFAVSEDGDVVLVSAIDNLVKGAAGQAVQVMNLRFGFHETAGLLPSFPTVPAGR